MSILVDPRIGSGDLVPTLRALGCPVESQSLDFADCAFVGNGPGGKPVLVGIELKQLDDILACVTSGRFSGHQLPGLVETYEEVYLVIEGIYRPNPKDGVLESRHGKDWRPVTIGHRSWMYRDFESFLTTIEIRGGVRLRRTSSRPETARMVAALYGWWQTGVDEHTSHLAIDRTTQIALEQFMLRGTTANLLGERPKAPSLRHRIAVELPGLGIRKGGMAAGHFPSVKAMIMASPNEWARLPGIGKLMANNIVDAVSAEDK